jgi:hypothetical protein
MVVDITYSRCNASDTSTSVQNPSTLSFCLGVIPAYKIATVVLRHVLLYPYPGWYVGAPNACEKHNANQTKAYLYNITEGYWDIETKAGHRTFY